MKASEYHSYYWRALGREPDVRPPTMEAGAVMTPEMLSDLITDHMHDKMPRYDILKSAYEGRFEIFGAAPKPDHKPDNRLAADIPKYLCDTFNGYFIGVPPTIRHEDERQSEWLTEYERRNNQEDVNAEIAEECDKYGHAFEMLFQDEEGSPASVMLSPTEAFVVYDDSVLKRPMYGVRYGFKEDGTIVGSFSDSECVVDFSGKPGALTFDDVGEHYFGGVPIIEYVENKERRGIYEGALSLIDAYNRVLSEKANDVDYFADAYLSITGVELGDDFKKNLRDYRLINLWDAQGKQISVQFLQKPNADATQENLIDRLETLIFKTSMVPDITNESFGTASGIALKMRLLPMSNLAKKKDRKFVASMRRRYRLLANYPNQPFSDWAGVEITMHRNMPEDIQSEAQAASSLSGIVSEETQLSVLSFVDDPRAEMKRKESEQESRAESISGGFPTNRTEESEEML